MTSLKSRHFYGDNLDVLRKDIASDEDSAGAIEQRDIFVRAMCATFDLT